MFYIVGLGNPGQEYEDTRHNAGRLILGAVTKNERLPTAVNSAKLGGLLSEGMLFGAEVRTFLPNTFMNQSGTAVKKLCEGGAVKDLIVVYDDVDIPLGEVRVSFDRGDGGHNGLKSIIETLGTKEFIRVRIGIAAKGMMEAAVRPSGDKLAKYVLGKFTKRELQELVDLQPLVASVLEVILTSGYEVAMNKFN
jgi:peptidyl-tRNA hydrolase, PTH1 family